MSHQDSGKNKRLHETIESLAHPDEQARELAQQIVNELNEKCMLLDLEGAHLGFNPDDGYPLVESLVAAFLAKARLAEAEWWADGNHPTQRSSGPHYHLDCKHCERIRSLRQAVGERE